MRWDAMLSARNSDPRNFDAKLSKKGLKQVEKLAENKEVKSFAPGLVVSSPHCRALQTAVAVFKQTAIRDGSPPKTPAKKGVISPPKTPAKKVVISGLLRETPRTTVPPNWVGQPQSPECRGRPKAVLRKDPCFKDQRLVDWKTLEDGAWWSEKIVSTEDTRQEAADFRTWLQKRPERKIAVVGHIGKLGNMVKKKPMNIWPKNAQPYFCVLRLTHGRPTLHYAGKTEAEAKKKQGQGEKLVLLVRHGKSQAQRRKEKRTQNANARAARHVKKTFLKKNTYVGGLPDGAVIRRTDKHAKPYIEARCAKVSGSTVGKVFATPISYRKDGKSFIYGSTDLRYDLQHGYLKCRGSGKL